MRLVISAIASLVMLSGCSTYNPPVLGTQIVEDQAPWISKFAALPEELQRYLLDRFDPTRGRPDLQKPSNREIITDERRWFAPSCSLGPGYSSTLFVRAKEVGDYWVILYEYGGIAHDGAILVLTHDANGAIRECDRIYTGLDPSTEKISDALKHSEKSRTRRWSQPPHRFRV